MTYIPERGHVVWLHFTPQAGHEQAGHRPALTLSPASYNGRTGLALFCPITNQAKGYPFDVRISDNLLVSGVILADQVKNLDWKVRGVKFVTTVDTSVLEEVVAKFEALLRPE